MSSIASYLIQMLIPSLIGALLWAFTRPLRRHRLARRNQHAGSAREGALFTCFVFLSGLLALTLTPAHFWPSVFRGELPHFPTPFHGSINLVPFRESWRLFLFYVHHGLWDAVWINFPGNILIFVPVGFFAGLLANRPRLWKSALLSLNLSLFIEIFQLFVSRGTDVDDLILNTFGGILGHYLFLLLRQMNPGFVCRCRKA